MSAPVTQAAQKAALRRALLARRAACLPPVRGAISARICAHLAALPAYQAAHTVFCFVGMEQEIDTAAFLHTVLKDEKILCVPYCVPSQKGVMHAKRLERLDALLPDVYGILSPPACAQTVSPGQIQLAVLPCVAADTAGVRLGYGGGYYDRYLALLPPACATVALCPRALVQPKGALPALPHDIAAQWVLTEEGLL